MKILITGSNGFIGKNLIYFLRQLNVHEIMEFNRNDDPDSLIGLIDQSDVIIHLAGEMRPKNRSDLFIANVGLTNRICQILKRYGGEKFIIFASSIQAGQDSLYGLSKRQAENELLALNRSAGTKGVIFRFPHVFGKLSRPNYNSVISTFCHNIARGLPIRIDDPAAIIYPAHIDDVVDNIVYAINNQPSDISIRRVVPEYCISIGQLADILYDFKGTDSVSLAERHLDGLVKALYLTYISYHPTNDD